MKDLLHPQDNFTGKVVLVTGAGRGSGRTLALELAALGVVVAANDISPVNVETLVDQICSSGGNAKAYIHDVAKKVDVQAMINNVLNDFGHIDLLVNNANVQVATPLLGIDEWDLHRIFEVNMIGTLLMMQSVGRVMCSQGGGIIVNLVKTGADVPATFAASQAGVAALTNPLNVELNSQGVFVFAMEQENLFAPLLQVCRHFWA